MWVHVHLKERGNCSQWLACWIAQQLYRIVGENGRENGSPNKLQPTNWQLLLGTNIQSTITCLHSQDLAPIFIIQKKNSKRKVVSTYCLWDIDHSTFAWKLEQF